MPNNLVGINNLAAEAIKAIAFFDLFSYPLTLLEIRNSISSKPSLSELNQVLQQLLKNDQASVNGRNLIEERNGFFYLNGRSEILVIRERRYNYTRYKIKRARLFANLFRLCPFVQVIAVANSIGAYNFRKESDIDFFIISRAGFLWLSRLYCTGLAKLLRVRPRVGDKQDKICLSFYLADDHLDITELKLPDFDPYFEQWQRHLILLYNKNGVYQKFLSSNKISAHNLVLKNSYCRNFLRFMICFESLAKKWQLLIMPAELKRQAGNSDGVVINDSIIKLYQHDRRREFAKKYGDKIQSLV